MKRIYLLAGALLMILVGCQSASRQELISGLVLNEEQKPIPSAVVRIKTTAPSVTSNVDGTFTIVPLASQSAYSITAWAPGYYIGGAQDIPPGATDVIITLKNLPHVDNPQYPWSSAFEASGDERNCETCHSGKESGETLLFDEWAADRHANTLTNERFITMYLGADVSGNQSPLREYDFNRDYGSIPLRPDPSKPYYGPGYKLDFPKTEGNCSACHAPLAAVNAPYNTDPTTVTGVHQEAISCDFCHKISEVNLNPANDLPYPNMPGVLSFRFLRPPEGMDFLAGPFDDVDRGKDTFLPLYRESAFCAPCHFGSFWDTQVYNSYGEWAASPYSDPDTGKTCQDCHMPAGRIDHAARLEEGGVLRDPQTISSHLMPGASDLTLLQNTVSLAVSAEVNGERLVVDVKITNDQAGHHVPTDSPLRQILLLVSAKDSAGKDLTLLEGERVPLWGGEGDPRFGYYAGLPGKGFAKILMELWTELSPTGSYWNPSRIVSDTRIAALESDTSRYVFSAPDHGKVGLTVTLLFRRAFKEVADQKGWSVPDIVMEEKVLILER